MFDSDPRTRTLAATPGREVKTHDRRRTKEEKDGRAHHPCPAHRWVAERRANRTARAAVRLPAYVAY